MRNFILAAALLTATASQTHADPQYDKCILAPDASNVEWNECGMDWIGREDKRLNDTWKTAFAKTSGAGKKSLLTEQRLWNEYKEQSCGLYQDEERFGREGQVLRFPDCRAKIIAQRTKELEAYEKALTAK